MNKKIESFLQEIHSLPEEKLDKKQLEKNLEMLISANPDIKANQAFKDKLSTRLNTIIDFKKWNNVVRKISYLKVLFPVFACLVLVVWVFSMVDIKLFNWDSSNLTILKNESVVSQDVGSNITKTEDISDPIQSDTKLSVKERILAKAAEEKAAESQKPTSSEDAIIQQQNQVSEIQEWTSSDASDTETSDEINEKKSDLPTPDNSEIFSTQLKATPPVNDTPETDLNIDTSEDFIWDEPLPSFVEELLNTNNDESDFTSQTWANNESESIQEWEIAKEMFLQSCEAFEGVVDSAAEIPTCTKNEEVICNQLDYENGKCGFLE